MGYLARNAAMPASVHPLWATKWISFPSKRYGEFGL
jgi:hypothetical protein